MSLLPSSPTVETRFRCGYSDFFIKLTEPARAGFQCNFAKSLGAMPFNCGVVIVAVAIVVQADLQWAYDLLDIVIVRPEAVIIYVSCQLRHVRESIVHRLCR